VRRSAQSHRSDPFLLFELIELSPFNRRFIGSIANTNSRAAALRGRCGGGVKGAPWRVTPAISLRIAGRIGGGVSPLLPGTDRPARRPAMSLAKSGGRGLECPLHPARRFRWKARAMMTGLALLLAIAFMVLMGALIFATETWKQRGR
jgi:hypothetical protein